MKQTVKSASLMQTSIKLVESTVVFIVVALNNSTVCVLVRHIIPLLLESFLHVFSVKTFAIFDVLNGIVNL